MDRRPLASPSVHEAARERPVGRILLNELSLQDRGVDVVERQPVGRRLLIGVIGDADSMPADRVNDVGKVHLSAV